MFLAGAFVLSTAMTSGCRDDTEEATRKTRDDDGQIAGTDDQPDRQPDRQPDGQRDRQSDQRPDIVAVATSAGNFDTLVSAVKAAELSDTLRGEGPFTVFAPNDAAFDKLPQESLDDLLKPENKKKLQTILTYHVVPGRITAQEIRNTQTVQTVQGESLDIATADDKVTINGANVLQTDIEASNGLIHVVDTVLMPPSAREDASAEAGRGKTIVEIAKGDQNFSTLVAALDAAGLADDLKGEGPFTVFAPTNKAFDQLGQRQVNKLLMPSNRESLQKILTYHVVSGEMKAGQLQQTETVETLSGDSLIISTKGEQAFVNNATILQTDVQASNGVIHVIDRVMIPADKDEPGGATDEILDTVVPGREEKPADEMDEDADELEEDENAVEESAEEAGKATKETVEDAGDTIEESAEEVGEATEESAEEVEEETEESAEEVEETVE